MAPFLIISLLLTLALRRNPLYILKNTTFRLPWLLIGCLAMQVALAWLAKDHVRSQLTPVLLVISFVGVLIGLYANRNLPGVKWVILGTILNLFALILHGGSMPVSEQALHLIGMDSMSLTNDSRHQLMTTTQTWWLGDWLPFFQHVLSPGDIIAGVGMIRFIMQMSRKVA